MAPHWLPMYFSWWNLHNPNTSTPLTSLPPLSREVNKRYGTSLFYVFYHRYIILCKWATFTIATSEFIQQLANWKITKETNAYVLPYINYVGGFHQMDVPQAIIHFRLGFSIKHPAIKGYHHFFSSSQSTVFHRTYRDPKDFRLKGRFAWHDNGLRDVLTQIACTCPMAWKIMENPPLCIGMKHDETMDLPMKPTLFFWCSLMFSIFHLQCLRKPDDRYE